MHVPSDSPKDSKNEAKPVPSSGFSRSLSSRTLSKGSPGALWLLTLLSLELSSDIYSCSRVLSLIGYKTQNNTPLFCVFT